MNKGYNLAAIAVIALGLSFIGLQQFKADKAGIVLGTQNSAERKISAIFADEVPLTLDEPECPAGQKLVGGACVITGYCCGSTTPVGGASTLSHDSCLNATTEYTYQVGVDGKLGPEITNYGYQICDYSAGIYSPTNGDLEPNLFTSQAQCNVACQQTFRKTTCAGWPGYSLPQPAIFPSENLNCKQVDDYGDQLLTNCTDSCDTACELVTTGFAWSCLDETGNKSARTEGAWLCPSKDWYSCIQQPQSPCEQDATFCVDTPDLPEELEDIVTPTTTTEAPLGFWAKIGAGIAAVWSRLLSIFN